MPDIEARKLRGDFTSANAVSKSVLDRWIDPAHRYFKLRGDDGGIYILRYSASEDAWELTLFDSGSRDESRLSST
jgi:hypothetical protein